MANTSARKITDYLLLTAKGMAMGAADVVPGVSGGTIAFITGIYSELLHSLKSITPKALLVLKDQGLVAAWRHINGTFLFCVFAGVLLSLKTFAKLITLALESQPILVWSFFFGLVLASIYYFASREGRWSWRQWLACVVAAAAVYSISQVSPSQLPDYWWVMLFAGFIAICAMILPGISGSFLLLIAGLYPAFLRAINEVDMVVLASFGVGCVFGLLTFSHFLSWLLDRYYQVTMAALIGFLVGSLNVIWPWKQTLVAIVDRHGETVPFIQENVLPHQYAALTGIEPQVLAAIGCLLFGAFLVLFTEYVSARMARNREQC